MGLPYMPIRPGVVDRGVFLGRQSYGSLMECLGDHMVDTIGRWHSAKSTESTDAIDSPRVSDARTSGPLATSSIKVNLMPSFKRVKLLNQLPHLSGCGNPNGQTLVHLRL